MPPFLPILNLLVFAAAAAVPPAPQSIKVTIPQNQRAPVVVELFTPDGCATCARADQMLQQLEKQQPVPGAEIIMLDEHVDSTSGFRQPRTGQQLMNRQADYNRFFHNDNTNAPQIVINGESLLADPSPQAVKEEIARAAARAKDKHTGVQVEVQPSLAMAVKVDRLPLSAAPCDVWMAVTEGKLETPWAAAEAPNRTLSHTAVVRSLAVIGRVDSTAPINFSMQARINQRWKRDDLKYVVFVQDPVSRKIIGATAVSP